MPFFRDLLLLGGLVAALLTVRAYERRLAVPAAPQLSVALPRPALPVAAVEHGSSADPTSPAATASKKMSSDENEFNHNGQLPQSAGKQTRTGIIDSFEPYSPKMIDDAPQSPPKLIDLPPPTPPKLVETVEPIPTSSPEHEPPPVKFFETETRATSIGYVVDCSSSMVGEKFQAVCLKLAESILALKRDQDFFVVFFNQSFFPMTGSAAPKLVPADLGNKRAILTFLQSAQASGGTNPEPALQFMTTVRPDVIYLLTDGEFSPLGQATYRGFEDAGIVVHTIGFETDGRVEVLEEIARRTSGTYQAAARGAPGASLLFASDQAVRAALSGTDPVKRREAARAAMLRGLPFEIHLIDMLRDSDADLRDTIQNELRDAADGSDFGPASPDDIDGAIRRWKLWRTLRGAGRSRILSALQNNDPDSQAVAAAVARAMKIDAPDEFIAALKGSPPNVVRELRSALVNCSRGEDFGPSEDATVMQVAEAADRWQGWRDAVLAREAAAQRELRIKRAADLLTQAKNLIGINDAAVDRRYRELMVDYGDTPAGAEARRLLEASVRRETAD